MMLGLVEARGEESDRERGANSAAKSPLSACRIGIEALPAEIRSEARPYPRCRAITTARTGLRTGCSM
jgi:hypothetical protein